MRAAPDLYARFRWFVRTLHACTVFAGALPLAAFVRRRALRGGPGIGVLVVAAIARVGLAVGALRHVAERASGRIAPGDGIEGKLDTSIDIAMETIGAAGAGMAALKPIRPASP